MCIQRQMRISDRFFGTYLNTCIFDIEAGNVPTELSRHCSKIIHILLDDILKFIIREIPIMS